MPYRAARAGSDVSVRADYEVTLSDVTQRVRRTFLPGKEMIGKEYMI